MEPLETYLQTALEAARQAGALQLELLESDLGIESKEVEGDLVTRADRVCEERIRDLILGRFPSHAIIGEEGGEVGSSTHRWIVDPIDGTVNYAHGFPHFNVSIALEVSDQVLVGVVHDPFKRETFTATKLGRAFLNGRPIRVSSVPKLGGRALVGVGATSDPSLALRDLEVVKKLAAKAVPVRRAASGALDLCYVACGRLDAFFEAKLMPWDCAAANLVVREAGGRVTNFDGLEFEFDHRKTLASNGLVHGEMLEMLCEW